MFGEDYGWSDASFKRMDGYQFLKYICSSIGALNRSVCLSFCLSVNSYCLIKPFSYLTVSIILVLHLFTPVGIRLVGSLRQ